MKNLSQKKFIYKFIICFCCALSFVGAYFIFSYGILPTDNVYTTILYIFSYGIIAYAIFEVLNSLTYLLFLRFIPNFCLAKNDYRYLLRVFITFRNIVYGLINIIFIFYPVASIWGILFNYCITTFIFMLLFYFNIKSTYEIKQNSYYYITRMSTVFCSYLVIYLLVGSLI